MSLEESFRDRTFEVEDTDCRIRTGRDDLLTFSKYATGDALPPGASVGDYRRIPQGSEVAVAEVVLLEAGSETQRVFALTTGVGGEELGWTSTRNFKGQFRNETLGIRHPEPGANRYGPNASWAHGHYLEQVDLVLIVSAELKVRQIALKTAADYFRLVVDCAADGFSLALNSGFRSYPEQKYLRDGWERGLTGFNLAAKAGESPHQNGIAFDLDLNGLDGSAIYDWLTEHGPQRGFFRTVNGEPWHWECDHDTAAALIAAGTYKTSNVRV